jgi:hypothetical protein
MKTYDPQYPQFHWSFFIVLGVVSLPFLYWLVTVIIAS